MKHIHLALFLTVILFAACTSQKGKVLFVPDPAQDNPYEQSGQNETWQIIETQNGPGETGSPEWVRRYYEGGKLQNIESLSAYSGKYVFVGQNRGDNFHALQQWTNSFTAAQDLSRLVVQRTEQRLIASASLYPDDEYGEYFALLIKKVSDGEYPGAVKEQTFWLKQKVQRINTDEEDSVTVFERYEFLILVSIDKALLQNQIQKIMEDIKPAVSPTRNQTAAINRIKTAFFEDF
jgi:hypothetical protein